MKESCKITSIIAHIDHGKTTLMDSMVAFQGCISKSLAGDLRYLDNRADEQSRQITLKLSPIKLSNGHVFIDTPGHVDLESLIFCSTVMADNHLILIDVNEGITPRTYSLVKYIDRRRAILVLNKVDKCRDADAVQLVIYQMNGLLGEEVFVWDRNNVIVCCAPLCCGVSHRLFKFSSKNTLKTALAAFHLLSDKYESNDVKEIMDRYGIKYKTKKNVLSAVMPLHAAVFDTIDSLYEAGATGDALPAHDEHYNEPPRPELKATGKTAREIPNKAAVGQAQPPAANDVRTPAPDTAFKCSHRFYSVSGRQPPSFLGITVYGIFKEKHNYTTENVLFITRIINGKITRGDRVFSTTGEESREVHVRGIYAFAVDQLVEVECAEGTDLVCLAGDFLKNSAISSIPVDFQLSSFLVPFYMSKISLYDISLLDSVKQTIRAIFFTEQCLKVRLNKYRELEVRCSGRVQFDKFCNDLHEAGYAFEIRNARRDFKEFATNYKERHCTVNGAEFVVKMGAARGFNGSAPCDNAEAPAFKVINGENGNIFCIRSRESTHIIESVLEVFMGSGPLIREGIINTFVCVDFIQEGDAKIYNALRNELSGLYLECAPAIAPRLLVLKISVGRDYLGALYAVLQKYFCVIDGEDCDEETGFYSLNCRVAQCAFDEINDDIAMRSKGTAYLEVEEAGYATEGDFSEFINLIRNEKGMHIDRKIVEDPEKQRTHKK